MLEPCLTQAAGLQGLAPPLAPKLIAVANHGDQQGELALLWSLCSTWVDMGLSVLVLDGHAHEACHNPGLQQLMEDPLGSLSDDPDAAAWSIQPAAHGLSLLANGSLGITSVGNCFQKFGIVLVYAGTAILSQVLRGSGLSPLLVVTPLKTSSLSAYQAMKQLLVDAHLQPTVANIALENAHTAVMTEPTHNLQDCALSFLGLSVKPITISATRTGEAVDSGIRRLALQLLESAVIMERQPIARTH